MALIKNWIPNPRAGWSTDGTFKYGGVGNNFTHQRSETEGPNGATTYKFFFHVGQTGDAGVRLASVQLPAGTYTLAFEARTDAQVTNAHVVVRTASYVVLGQRNYGGSRAWARDSITFTLSQTENIEILFGLGSYGPTSGGTAWFTQFILAQGATPSVYFDGSTPDIAPTETTPGHTYSWAHVIHNSASTWDNNVTLVPVPTDPPPVTPPTGPPATVTGFELVDFDDFAGNSLNATRWGTYGAGSSSSGPDTGWKLWVDPNNQINTLRSQFSDPIVLAGVDYITQTPAAKWLGIEWVPIGSPVLADSLADADAKGQCAVFVLYSIVGRDYGQSSSGGAENTAEYLAWINWIADTISSRYVVLPLEPDALPQLAQRLADGSMTQEEYDSRMDLLVTTKQILRAKCANAKLYDDNGHSQWMSSAQMAPMLAASGVEYCHGIAENVSNFRPTADCERHAEDTIDILESQFNIPVGQLGYVIDSSRNGAQTPPIPQDWQNPPGVAMGKRSRFNPAGGIDGKSRKHGEIWIKVPGESDGQAFSGGDAWPPPFETFGAEPPAGNPWKQMTEHIIRNSVLENTEVSGHTPAIVANGVVQILGEGNFVGGITYKGTKQRYGRWEVKSRIDRGPGYSPLIQLKGNMLADGAIGVMTHRDGGADEVIFLVRDGNNNLTETQVPLNLTVQHTFAVEWTASAITFFVDGGQAWQVTDATKFPPGSLGLDLGLVLGTGSPIPARNSTTPQPFRLIVDSIGVYKAITSTGGGEPPPPTADLPDWYYDANGNRIGAPPSMGVTQARQYARAIYDAFFAFTLTTDGCQPGEMRIKRPDQGAHRTGTLNGTVSEGQGYAMRLAVIWNNPALPANLRDAQGKNRFDALWRYTKRYLNSRGLMDWSIDFQGTRTDTGGATDGDLDIAEALWMADEMWGSNGAINYAAEASKMTAAIAQHEFTADHTMKNGDQWGDAQDYMPDYFRPGAMRRFMAHDGSATWETRINANYPIAMGYFNQTYATGMVPDWCNRQSQPVPGQSYKWSYNAIRHPWGVVREALLYPAKANPLATQMANKLATFGKNYSNGNPANLKSEWELNGNPTQQYINMAFVHAFGVASILNAGNADFASACLQFMYDRRTTDQTYFGLGLAAQSAATMAGVDQLFTTRAPIESGSTTISFRDVGGSSDSVTVRVSTQLGFHDVGSSSDRVTLSIPVEIGFTDIGGSRDLVSLEAGGNPAVTFIAFTDRGGSADSVAFFQQAVRLSFYDVGYSSESVELVTTPLEVVRPVVSGTAELIYAALGPMTQDDELTGWHLLSFCETLSQPIQDDLKFTDWVTMLDADKAPDEALDWVGQFVGISDRSGTPEIKRLRMKEASGFARGTPEAIIGAARVTLTGARRVQLFERAGSPYRIRVVTFAAETPDRDATYRALMQAKPAGIKLEFTVAAGMSYGELKATGLNYGDLGQEYPTYEAMRMARPEVDE